MVTNFLKEPRKEGITDDEWIRKRNMKIGMWNVRTLFWSGALKVLHKELSDLDFDIVTFQETWLESDIQKFDLDQKVQEFGCSFYVSGEFLEYVKDFKIINERICCLRIKAKWFSCTVINVHAPTNEKREQIKEEFYNLLEQNINQTARSDIKIILGDFNAKVVKVSI